MVINDIEPTREPSVSNLSIWDILLLMAGSAGTFLLGSWLIGKFFQFYLPNYDMTSQNSILLSTLAGILECIALVGSVYILLLLRRHLSWRDVGIQYLRRSWGTVAVLLSFIIIPLTGIVAAIVQYLIGQPMVNSQVPFLAPQGFSWISLISMLLLGGILAPFAEELFFRGVIYQWFRHRWGFWIGSLLSSLLFAVLHGDLTVGTVAFLLGMVMAWIYERSQSLWAAVIIHVINNSSKILLLYFLLARGIKINGL